MEPKIFSVFEITSQIKSLLESRFIGIEVQGEVTNYKVSSTGHIYFTLKDEKAALNCVLFKSKFSSTEPTPFKNGDLLIAKGSLGLYEPAGSYQLIVRSVSKAGIGDLLAKIQLLKEKYQKLGYFDQERKKAIPKQPKKIAVITALTGAVIQDIIKVLKRRVHTFHLLVFPVKVQGEGAALEIKEAIETIDQMALADVMIVARGGGSFEDLLPFNDSMIVEAIYQSKVPVISAVGHEVDFTLCDFVSDLRAPTPSSAAEMVCQATAEIMTKLHFLFNQIKEKSFSLFTHRKKQLETNQKILYQKGIFQNLNQNKLNIDNLSDKIEVAFENRFYRLKEKILFLNKRLEQKNPVLEQLKKKESLDKLNKRLESHLEKILLEKKNQNPNLLFNLIEKKLKFYLTKKEELLKSFEKRLQALNPKMILKKGYCIPFHANSSSIIRSANDLEEEKPFEILFHDGKKIAKPLIITKELS